MRVAPLFDPGLPVKEILARYPHLRSALASHGLDACCGGEHALSRACAAKRVGRRSEGEIFLPLPLSRQDIADLVGTTIETAIRVMSRWQKEGIVDTDKTGFRILDAKTLREIAPPAL